MDLTVVPYVGFVITALFLIWAVIEINKRLSRRDKSQNGMPHNWAELDAKHLEAREELPAKDMHLDEGQTELEGELHARAKQNGHHAPRP